MSSHECTTLGLWGGESEDIIKRDFPIHRACRDGDLGLLRQAWAVASYDQLTAEDKFYGWTPIHWAAYFGKIDCLNALLEYGISVNLCTTKFKQTPCHIASFGGHPQCLLALLRAGANFHAQDYLGESPIHKAARVGNVECIGVLLENGSRVGVCNNNGHTPCDLARMQNFQECVMVLEGAGKQQMQDMNCGIRNGTSGILLGRINGYQNGEGHLHNGFHNGYSSSNKRMLDDESIPYFKRRRFDGMNGNHSPMLTNGNGHDVTMDMDESIPICNGNHPNGSSPRERDCNDTCARAPSPGMDLNLEMDEDMQLWCHQNGYGDTAESMPASSCLKHRQAVKYEASYDRALCAHLRGVQARGWH